MFRRQFIRDVPALVGTLAVTGGFAIAEAASAPSAGTDEALLNAALECVKRGELCSAHCVMLLGQGDKTLAECQRRVRETVAVCGALASLAAQGSAVTGKLAAVALEVCRSCEQECRKHEKQHAICKDCAEACVACARECKRAMA